MIAIGVWQGLLDAIGWLLAHIYDFIPNYGLSIIALTVLTRLVLLPLGIKQIRSMQNMQAIQPKVKAIQQKYKGNRQKQNEEVMKVYQEAGVNPLSGCRPMLLQLPILVTFYSVLRYPQSPPHLPAGSELRLHGNGRPQIRDTGGLRGAGELFRRYAHHRKRGPVELDGQWIAEAILGGAGGDANPAFADAILFHVCLFDPLEANAHAAFQDVGVVIGTVGIGGEAVRRDISHCKSFWLGAHVSGLP